MRPVVILFPHAGPPGLHSKTRVWKVGTPSGRAASHRRQDFDNTQSRSYPRRRRDGRRCAFTKKPAPAQELARRDILRVGPDSARRGDARVSTTSSRSTCALGLSLSIRTVLNIPPHL